MQFFLKNSGVKTVIFILLASSFVIILLASFKEAHALCFHPFQRETRFPLTWQLQIKDNVWWKLQMASDRRK